MPQPLSSRSQYILSDRVATVIFNLEWALSFAIDCMPRTWRLVLSGCHVISSINASLLTSIESSLLFVRVDATCTSERVQLPPSCRGIVQISTSKASSPFSMPTSVVPLMVHTADLCGLWRNPRIRGHHSPLRDYHHHCYYHNRRQGSGDCYFKCSPLRRWRCWLPPRSSPRRCTERVLSSEGRNCTCHVLV